MAYGDVTKLGRSVLKKWVYSNNATYRLNPEKYGKTDCSGFARWGFKKAYGLIIGSWTGDEAGAGVEIWRGTDPAKIPFEIMHPDDIILMSCKYDDWTFAHYWSHIEVYAGARRMIGAPGTPCPDEKDVVSWIKNYMKGGAYPRIMVRRVVHYPAKDPHIRGIDVSNWQCFPLNDVAEAGFSKSDFVIVKATQGTTFISPTFNRQAEKVLKAGKLLGIYHYAAGGDPAKEAAFFAEAVKPYQGRAVLVVDWESNQNKAWKDATWCKKFLDALYSVTGVRGLVYVQASAVSQCANCAKSYGLWLAGYPDNRNSWNLPAFKFKTGAWGGLPHIWQYTSSGGKLDRNVSHMTAEEWKARAAGDLAPVEYVFLKGTNIRTGCGISFKKKGYANRGDRLTVYKTLKIGKRVYGWLAKFRWVCLEDSAGKRAYRTATK